MIGLVDIHQMKRHEVDVEALFTVDKHRSDKGAKPHGRVAVDFGRHLSFEIISLARLVAEAAKGHEMRHAPFDATHLRRLAIRHEVSEIIQIF